MKRKILDIAIMIFCTSVFLWGVSAYVKSENTDTSASAGIGQEAPKTGSGDLTIWYTDAGIEPYLQESVHDFSAGTQVDIVEVSILDYLENINKLNLAGEDMPDLYVLDSSMLEKAYLAGLTQENIWEVYNKDNYSQTALSAATYHNKLIAYPFYFNTGFMVYNKQYAPQAPKTFDDILEFARNFDSADYQGVENILKWNAKDLLINYGFIGNYLEFGGSDGDDSSVFNLKNENLAACLDYYHNLNQYFYIDIDTVEDSQITEEFISGKTIFSLLSLKDLKTLNESKIDYGITEFPDLTDTLQGKGLSAAKVIVVNPYAKDRAKAEKLAKYLTYEKADKIIEFTNYAASRKYDSYSVKGMKEIMKQYENSESLPKLMAATDFWVQAQNMLNNIWKGADITTELNTLESKMQSHMDTD